MVAHSRTCISGRYPLLSIKLCVDICKPNWRSNPKVTHAEVTIFTLGSTQRLLFVAVCKALHPSVNQHSVSKYNPAGGKSGIGEACLKAPFRHCRLFRLHAVFHDAYGVIKNSLNVGPGCFYAVSNRRPNGCLPVYITDIFVGWNCFLFNRAIFKSPLSIRTGAFHLLNINSWHCTLCILRS